MSGKDEIAGDRNIRQMNGVGRVLKTLDSLARGAVCAVERRPRVLPGQRASLPAIVLLWWRDVGLHVPVVEVSASAYNTYTTIHVSEMCIKTLIFLIH